MHPSFIIAATELSSDSKSTSSTISTAEIKSIIDKLRMGRLRDSTKNNYYSIWKIFNEFFIKLDSKPESWEERIILFAGYLVHCHKRSQTVKSYVSAVKAVLKDDSIFICENKFLLTSLIQACKFKNDKIRTRIPIQKGLLKLILKETERFWMQENQPYLSTMYKALFATAYFGMFRVGELATGDHPVKACDVHIASNKNKLCFVLRTSKTHWTDKQPQIIKISGTQPGTNSSINCPFNLLREYLNVPLSYIHDNEPFFIFNDRTPVKPNHVRVTLRHMIKTIGLNPLLYSVHSMRAGRSLDLLNSGVEVQLIRKLGRWSSNCVYTYLRG